MIVDIFLYKKNISPKNLPIFENENDREEFFRETGENVLAINNCSFNGNRNIRISVNYFTANLSFYNYCKIKYNKDGKNFVYYCFIDYVKFLNDNSSELFLTLDYITTFYFDIKFPFFKLVQTTRTKNYLQDEKKFYFSNNISCASLGKKVYDFSFKLNETTIKFLLINIKYSQGDLNYVDFGTKKVECIIYPIICDNNETNRQAYSIPQYFYVKENDKITTYSFSEIYSKIQGKIINISSVENVFANSNDLYYDNGKLTLNAQSTSDDCIYEILATDDFPMCNAREFSREGILPIKSDFLYRQPYKFYSLIRNNNENLLDFSANDFSDKIDIHFTLRLDINYPNSFELTLHQNDNKYMNNPSSKRIKIKANAISVEFSESQWSEYFLQNSASVNDGLQTKHKYDLENAELQRTASQFSAVSNLAGGAAKSASSFASGNVVSGIGYGASSLINLASDLTTSEYAYRISENNIEKEKALLNIQWNDIKAAPAKYSNIGVDNTNEISDYDTLCLYEMIPLDFYRKLIRSYHMEYGYEINYIYNDKATNEFYYLNDILKFFETGFPNYKFLRIEGNVIASSIPQQSIPIIENIFSDGIRFYNKNNLLEIENENFSNFIPSDYFD